MNILLKDRTGEQNFNKEGLLMTILNYRIASDVDIIFENGYVSKNRLYQCFKQGRVKNLLSPSVYGIGFLGEGDYISSIKGRRTKANKAWYNMFERCYSDNYHIKYPTYIGCSVHPDWHNFQNFAEWFEENYVEGFALDKDILFKGNKIYSPETCCFVPQKINAIFIRRGKFEPNNIKCLAEKFKNQITEQVYQALINYQVEIID